MILHGLCDLANSTAGSRVSFSWQWHIVDIISVKPSILFCICKMRKEESYANKSITAIMKFGINYASISFSTYYGISFFHLFHNTSLPNRSRIGACNHILKLYLWALLLRQIRYCISRSIFKDIISDRNKSIFFTKHRSIFTYNCQTVNIRVNNKTYISLSLDYELWNTFKVFRQWFRVMCKLPIRSCIKFNNFFTPRDLRSCGRIIPPTELTQLYGNC